MDGELLARIDKDIEECRADLAEDVIRLIAVKSVKGAPLSGAPFGEGPRAMLDAVMDWGRKEGFYAEDHGVGVIHVAERKGQPDLGIWLHGDVVPEGEGWEHDPYNAVEYKGCIIGRGATDNKGQLCAIFHLMKIFRGLGISLSYLPAMYVGSDEESGMYDIKGVPGNEDAKGFINCCTPPRLSLVPDSSFPVGYGGRGSMNLKLRSKKTLHGITITAGRKEAPGNGEAHIGGETIKTFSFPRHMTNPDPDGNMITELMDILLKRPDTDEADRPVLSFFKDLSLDIHGDRFGINVPAATMKPLTLAAFRMETKDGRPEIVMNIRYPIEITAETIKERIAAAAAPFGLEVSGFESRTKPYLLDKNNPVIGKILEISNGITKENKEPYTLSGGTYAHLLPNALVVGMDGCKKPDDYPKNRGGAHGLDELVSLDRLQRAMRIYARIMLMLNETEW